LAAKGHTLSCKIGTYKYYTSDKKQILKTMVDKIISSTPKFKHIEIGRNRIPDRLWRFISMPNGGSHTQASGLNKNPCSKNSLD
jgi:hypothetical protein